jgi:DNA-binding SARP family transcriptional activator
MSRLRLLVLGPPRLERDGQPAELNLRRAVALLVYLAVTSRPHGREALAALLWPDGDESEARGRLRRTLHRLAEALGDDVVVTDGDTLRLSPSVDLWLDSRAFEHHAAAGLATTEAQPPDPERLEHLTRAAGLYADDFLAGFALPDSAAWDEWQFLRREHLRQVCARVLECLVAAHRARGEWEVAIGHARRWLALDPLHEPAQRALMQLYAFAGQQAAALRQYQECARLLEAELGLAPEKETTALYEAVKARRLTAPVAVSPVPVPAPVTSATAVPADRPPSVPLPETRYARSGDVSIAYQVVGDGPIDIVFVMGWVTHLDYFWQEPGFARFLGRLASSSRLILFDKRGTGLSDRAVGLPSLEQRIAAATGACPSRRAATWPSTSPAHGTWSCQETTTFPSWETRMRSLTRCSGS